MEAALNMPVNDMVTQTGEEEVREGVGWCPGICLACPSIVGSFNHPHPCRTHARNPTVNILFMRSF